MNTVPRSVQKRLRTRRLTLAVVVVAVVLPTVAFGVWRGSQVLRMPGNLDTALQQNTANGLYRVTLEPDFRPVPLNTLQTWTIRLATTKGRPVRSAEVRVSGGMPQHGHGLPTAPQVSATDQAGVYRLEGLKFQMPGWWVLDVTVRAPSGHDTAHFNLVLK